MDFSRRNLNVLTVLEYRVLKWQKIGCSQMHRHSGISRYRFNIHAEYRDCVVSTYLLFIDLAERPLGRL